MESFVDYLNFFNTLVVGSVITVNWKDQNPKIHACVAISLIVTCLLAAGKFLL